MDKKGIAVIGSTGSVGRQAIEVAEFLGLGVYALAAAGNNMDLLCRQIARHSPRIVAVAGAEAARELAERLKSARFGRIGSEPERGAPAGAKTEILYGEDGLRSAASESGAGTVVAAASGTACAPAIFSAIKAGKTVALANKETLVEAGKLVMEMAAAHSAAVIPVDSEHSAIFQCLRGRDAGEAKRLIITASGGPFKNLGAASLAEVTPEQAAAHPVWSMGRKISVDSATLANKGLEVIEASVLFGMPPDCIEVLIHPQSVVHSMVEFRDNAIIAQMGEPDMRVPIQYALTYPERRESLAKPLDLCGTGALTFEKPDCGRFPCLALAYAALRAGGTMPAVYNAANEAAVELFVGGMIGFTDIPALISAAMDRHAPAEVTDFGVAAAARAEAREYALAAAKNVAGPAAGARR